MAIRGTAGKANIQNLLLSNFPGAFVHNKIIYIPTKEEDGSIVEIKVTLTAAKENVQTYDGGIPEVAAEVPVVAKEDKPMAPTSEEIARLQRLMQATGFSVTR